MARDRDLGSEMSETDGLLSRHFLFSFRIPPLGLLSLHFGERDPKRFRDSNPYRNAAGAVF